MADDSFLKQCGGFNPAPDFLIQKYGFEAAHVWGAVWRYCQMSEKERPRSHEAMAERAGMSRRTFIKYLILLIKDGYIEDLDPGVRNRPHLYDTKKGEELIKVGMQISHTESAMQEDRCAEFAQDSDVGMRNLHTSYAELAQPGMQNLHLIDSKEIQVKDTKDIAAKAPLKIHSIPAVQIFVEVTGKYCLSKPQMKEVGEVIGDTPTALEKWRAVVKEWLMRGFKPTNVAGMLEWFKGEIPVYQNGAKHNGQQPTKDHRPEFEKRREAGQSVDDEFTAQLRDLRGPNLAGLTSVPSRP